jgi:hypothetical protein
MQRWRRRVGDGHRRLRSRRGKGFEGAESAGALEYSQVFAGRDSVEIRLEYAAAGEKAFNPLLVKAAEIFQIVPNLVPFKAEGDLPAKNDAVAWLLHSLSSSRLPGPKKLILYNSTPRDLARDIAEGGGFREEGEKNGRH